MLYAASTTAARRPRLAEPRPMPTAASPPGRTPVGSLGESAPRAAGGPSEPHHRPHRSRPRRSVSPVLSRQDVLKAVNNRLEHTAQFISPGSVVVYEFLSDAQEWHWALGTVQQVHTHTVTLAEWSCQQGGANDGVMQALKNERSRAQQELEDHQATILALRAELGAVRTRNEADMNATREAIEARRRELEARESAFRVCRQRGVPLQRTHKDGYGTADESDNADGVFAAVLRAALSIVEDYVPATPLPWPEVWATVSDPHFLHRCIDYDVGYDMSFQQYDDIEARFFGSGAITEAKVHRAMASMEQRMPDAAELLCTIANWVFTQIAAFRVYQQCASTQSHADVLQQRLTHHVNALKAAARKLRQVQAQLRVFSGAPGTSRSATSSDVQFTFVPAQGISTEVLRCAIICPAPSNSRRHPGTRVTAAQTTAASGELKSPSSTGKGAGTMTVTTSSSGHPSLNLDALGNRHLVGSAAAPSDSTRSPHHHGEQVQPTPCPPSASAIPVPNAATEVVLLGHEELEEIAARAVHARPELYQAVDDLLQECGHHQRDAHHARALVSERADRRRGRRETAKLHAESFATAAAWGAAPGPTTVSSGPSTSVTLPTSHSSPVAAAQNVPTMLSLPGSKDAASQSDDEDGVYEEEADARAFQAALLGLQRQLQEARRENEQLQRMLLRETDRHGAVEAELQRQLRDARADHEDAKNREADATIRAEALQAECEDLDRNMGHATSRISALENELGALLSKLCSGGSAAPASPAETSTKADERATDASSRVAELEAELAWLRSSRERWMPDRSKCSDPADGVVTTHHHKRLNGSGWCDVLQRHPAELRRAAATDAAAVCHVVAAAVTGVHFSDDGSRVEFYVEHPRQVTKRQLDARIHDTPFYECEYMLHHCSSPKTGEDILAQQLAQRNATIADLEIQLANVSSMPAPLQPSPADRTQQEDLLHLREQLRRASEEIEELNFYDERRKKSGNGEAVVTTHAVKLPGEDWSVVVQEHPEALREAFVADVSHAGHVNRGDVEHIAFGMGSLLATVRVQHDADVTMMEMDRRLQEYDYPLTMELYRLRHGPKRGADAALATVAKRDTEIADLREQLRGAMREAAASSEICTALEKQVEEAALEIRELREQLAITQLRREALDAECAELEQDLLDVESSREANVWKRREALEDRGISHSAKDAEMADLREQLREAEERARDVEAQQSDRDAEMADLREQLREAEERARDVEAQQSDRDAEIERVKELLSGAMREAAASSEICTALEKQVEEAALEIRELREQLAVTQVRREALDAECGELEQQLRDVQSSVLERREAVEDRGISHSAKDAEVADLREQLRRASEEIEELNFYDERRKKSGNGEAVVTTHAVKLPGEDWSVVVQEHPEALREAFVADVSHAGHVNRGDVEHIAFGMGSLLATVRVQHDADVTMMEMDRRLQEYDYPLTMELYRLRHGPKRGADAALATVAKRDTEIADLREQLRGAMREAAASSEICTALEKPVEEAALEIRELREQLAITQLRREALDAECAELEQDLLDVESSREANVWKRREALEDRGISHSAKDAEMADLREQLREAEERARDVEAQQSDRDAEMADLREQLREAEERARDVEAQQSDRDAEVADLREQLREAEERARDVEAQQSDRDAEMADLREQLREGEERARDVEAQQSDRDAEMADLREQLREAEERARDVEAQQSDRDAEMADLREQLREGEERARDVEAQQSDRDAEMADLREQLREAEERARDVEAQQSDRDAEVADLREQLREAEERARDVEAQQSDRDAEMADLREQLREGEERARDVEAQQSDRDAEMADLREQLREAEERARDVEAQQSDRDAEVADLREQLREAEERARDVEAQQSDRDAEMADLREQLREAEERARDVEAQQSDRDAEMADLREQLREGEERARDVEAQQSDRDAEMADLREQLREAEERARDVEAQQSDRDAEVADLREQLREAEERARDVEAQQSDRDAEMADLREQLREGEERARDVEAQQSDRDAEMADLREQLREAEERARDVEAQQSDRDAEMADLREQLREAEERARDVEAQQSDRDAEMADLREQLREAEERARDVEAQQSDRDAEMADLREQLREAEERARDVEAQQSDRDAEMADLREQLREAEERARDVEAQQSDRDAEMADLREQLREGEERARDVEAQQSDRDAEMADLREQLREAEERARDVEAQQSDRDAEVADLREQLREAEERARDVEAQQSDRDAEMADLREQLREGEERARDVEAQQSDRDAEIERVKELLSGAMREAAASSEICTALEKQVEEAALEIRELREQLAVTQVRREALDAECGELEQQLRDVQSSVLERREAVEDLSISHSAKDAEVADLREQLREAEERARDVEAQQSDRDAEVADLREQLREAEERARDVEAQQSDRDAEMADLREQLREAEERARDVEAQQSDRDAEMADLREQLREAEERARDVEAQQSDRDAEMADLREQLREAEERARDVEAQQSDRDVEMADLREQLREAEERARDVEAQQSDRDAEMADLREQLREAEERARDVEAQQSDRDAEMADLREQLREAEERARDVEAQQSDRDAEVADLREQLREAEERARDVEAQQSDRDAEIERVKELLSGAMREAAASSEICTALEKQVEEAALEIRELREQLAVTQVRREALDAECGELEQQLRDVQSSVLERREAVEDRGISHSAKDAEVADLREQLRRASEEIEELNFYDERRKKSGNGEAVVTTHAVKLPGEDWSVVVQEHPEALREAFVADVSHAGHVNRGDVEHIAFGMGSLLATVRVQHDADVTMMEMDRRLQEYDYPLTMELYRLRHGPKRGADAALATVAKRDTEIAELYRRLCDLEDEASALRRNCAEVAEAKQRGQSVDGSNLVMREAWGVRDERGGVAELTGADAARVEEVIFLTTSEESQRAELWRRMLEEALWLSERWTELLVVSYEDRLRAVEQDHELTSIECTDMLERLEEFVNLLEAARAAERAAVDSRDDCERELRVLQERYDREVAANQRLFVQREGRAAGGVSGTPSWAAYDVDSEVERDRSIDDSLSEPDYGGDDGARSPPVSRTGRDVASGGLREQLEQLKREKEALMKELEAKGMHYRDALGVLNQHISQLMEELSLHLCDGVTSANNARALLLEIAELRAGAQERTGAVAKGGSTNRSSGTSGPLR